MFGLRSPTRPNPELTQFFSDAEAGRAIIIDVRDISEVKASGKVKGAKHIPLMQLANVVDRRHPDYDADLTAEAEIAVYCASGGRSQMALQILFQLGFQNVTNIGGFGQLAAGGADIDPV